MDFDIFIFTNTDDNQDHNPIFQVEIFDDNDFLVNVKNCHTENEAIEFIESQMNQ